MTKDQIIGSILFSITIGGLLLLNWLVKRDISRRTTFSNEEEYSSPSLPSTFLSTSNLEEKPLVNVARNWLKENRFLDSQLQKEDVQQPKKKVKRPKKCGICGHKLALWDEMPICPICALSTFQKQNPVN